MTRSANGIDFWRGVALITIFVNHVPGIYFEHVTHRNFSISDSADLFVFLAGWAVAIVVTRSQPPLPPARIISRLGGRALVIYAAHILIVMLAIGLLAASARLLESPLLLEWHNAASVFYNPADTHIGLVLLTHHLGYFDILPLYVVLMLIAPLVALIDRYLPHLLLPFSLTIYVVVLSYQINLPSWPNNGQWFFNPLAWQLTFVLGYVLCQDRGIGHYARSNIDVIRIASVPIVLAGALAVWYDYWPDPTNVPEPQLLFLNYKTYATPMRIIQFLALAALMSAAFPHIHKVLPWLARFCSMLGRNSLNVFCVSSILSLVGQILRFAAKGSVAVDTLIFVVGIAALGLTAWISEWHERTKRPA
ncbi:MAG: OpgC domain-containing protein [Alphaproteobacteria bacterium]|nr:OpgC domain-containing protein [Alphaproteobacteria bacterium]